MLTIDSETVLDLEQLRDVTLGEPELMREILDVLLEDTLKQIVHMEAAIAQRDAAMCRRLAHYSKGACANVGANRAAAALLEMERLADRGEFAGCSRSLAALGDQIELLRVHATSL